MRSRKNEQRRSSDPPGQWAWRDRLIGCLLIDPTYTRNTEEDRDEWLSPQMSRGRRGDVREVLIGGS